MLDMRVSKIHDHARHVNQKYMITLDIYALCRKYA
jgi:hypothetical protein